MPEVSRRTLLVGAAGTAVAVAGARPMARAAAEVGAPALPGYLTGVREPVPDEIEARELTVEGRIPPELTGRYLRNGPNPPPGVDPGNWWMGAGMLHGIRLRGGRAEWYRNRWVRSVNEPPNLPDGSPNLRVSRANTSVIQHAGKVLALFEVCLPYRVTSDLDTVGPEDFGGRLHTAMTAHPMEDPVTGELHFFGYSTTRRPYLTYHRLSATGELVRSVPIDLPEPVMMHDFAVTANHIVWLDLPLVWDDDGRRTAFPNWSDTHEPRIGVMPKDGTGSDIRWFPVDPRWAFHVGNAYEDRAGRIVLDYIGGTGPEWIGMRRYFLGLPEGRGRGQLRRWTIDLRAGRVREHQLDEFATEFPTINDTRAGREHRYLYSQTTPLAPTRHNRIVKHDTRTGARLSHYLGSYRVAGETLFVAAPGARREDDGWLLSIVHDLTRSGASLMILDATAPAGRPVAVVHLPRRVPYGFHGCWLPDTVSPA